MSAELPHDLDSLEGFERLYRAYYGYAWTVLVRLGVPPAVVDDAHQDVFVTAYRRRDTFQRGRPVKPCARRRPRRGKNSLHSGPPRRVLAIDRSRQPRL